MTNQIRISLTEQDFLLLCCGRTLKYNGAEICLKDIGFDRIVDVAVRVTDGRAFPACEEGCTLRKYHYGACLPP